MLLANFASILLLASALLTSTTAVSFSSQENKDIVEKLLEDYNGNIRPDGENGTSSPTIVVINMYVRSISEFDDVKMSYKTQLTFRTQWLDPRLKFDSTDERRYVTLIPTTTGNKLWRPDLFFSNELQFTSHDGLLPNEYYRVFPNGEVLHSTRISVKWSCPMTLRLYPFDQQTCSMRMASYGYTTDDIIFKWKARDPIQVTSELHLRGFSLEKFTTDYCDSTTNTGTYSCLRVDFLFQRDFSSWCHHLFLPMIMSLLLIWVSTWITPSYTGATLVRALLLGGSSLYCKVTLWSFRPMPQISYTTALDVWDMCCTTFILLAIVEFVVVLVLRSGGKGDDDFSGSPGSRRIDIVMRIIYPIAIVACVCIYFATVPPKTEDDAEVEMEEEVPEMVEQNTVNTMKFQF